MNPEKHIQSTDAALRGIEDITLKRIQHILEVNYLMLLDQLDKRYDSFTSAKMPHLLGQQRALLLLGQLTGYMQVFKPEDTLALEMALEGLLDKASQHGVDLAGQLLPKVEMTVKVPIAALRYVVEDSRRRLYRHSDDFASRTSAAVSMGLVQGWGFRKTARVLRANLDITRSQSETIVRTESIAAMDSATRQNYAANGVQWVIRVATQDNRVCGYCAFRAGKAYKLEDAPAAIHPNDRCYNTPLKPEWIKAGVVNSEWYKNHSEDCRARCEEPLQSGAAPFERYAKAEAPEAVFSFT